MGTREGTERRRMPPPPPPTTNAADGVTAGAAGSHGEVCFPLDTPAHQFNRQLNRIGSRVNEVEEQVKEVTCFYGRRKPSRNLRGVSGAKESKTTERMQELMEQFGKIFSQIQQHDCAKPFMNPVDVEGLGLDDYFDIIKKPMDFSTIKKRMEGKDVTVYKNVREIYADVRLTLKNATTYNNNKDIIHVMANTLLGKLKEKWLSLLPKVIEEERIQAEDEAQAHGRLWMAQEGSIRKIAAEADTELEELKRQVVQNCKKMSVEEKRNIGIALGMLSHDDLEKAIDIIAQENPDFQLAEEVNLDLDEQSEVALWRLKFFIRRALDLQSKELLSKVDKNLKRKEICNALTKTAKK